jgi:hypothetical protein
MDPIAFAAVNTVAAAFLELPMPVMKVAMLFNIPTFLFIEHRDVLTCLRDGDCPGSTVAQLDASLVRVSLTVINRHTVTAPLAHPRFLSRALLLLAVCGATHIVSQLLLNGHKVLARHTASPVANQTSCVNGRRVSTLHAPRSSSGPLPWAWIDDWAAWTHQCTILRALYLPVASKLPDAALDAELVFMRTALSMRMTHFIVPILCTPVVAYSYVM